MHKKAPAKAGQIPRPENLAALVHAVRGEKVLLDTDLASLYGVTPGALNQAVKRNRSRFPDDFMFRLTRDEAETVLASRSQSVILKRGQNIKYLPYAFTEQGVAMLSSVRLSARIVKWQQPTPSAAQSQRLQSRSNNRQ